MSDICFVSTIKIIVNSLISGKNFRDMMKLFLNENFFSREYVMALSAASVVNRLRLVETMFSVFDLDSDGKISKDEMEKMLRTLADVTDNNRKRRRHRHDDDRKRINLQKRLDEAFNELNSNDDEYITKDEFIEWYMKSGLLSDVQTNEINVPNNTRIQQLNRKSRFMRRQRKDEQTQPVRYITRMTEQRTIPIDNDEHVDVPEKINSEDNDSCYSKENERWQHLFNSVLGQIRSQRADLPNNSNAHSPTTNHFSSWRRQGEEKLTSEYYRQKSSDIDTVRL